MPKASKELSKSLSGFEAWVTHGEDKRLVSNTNSALQRAKVAINELKIPVFGSSLYRSDNTSCVFHDADSIIASVVADRFTRKFECPSLSTEQLLKRNCFDDWRAFERGHVRAIERSTNSKHDTRRAAIRARSLIKSWLKPPRGGRYKGFWEYFDEAPVEFGPGESFTSTSGDTSIFTKISPAMVFPQGTVTIEAAEIAAILIASNKALRECYKAKLKALEDPEKYPSPPDFESIANAELQFDIWLNTSARKFTKRVALFARQVYSRIFYAYKVDHEDCLVKRGSRASSVYKDATKRRFINIECLWNSVIQKMIGWAIRQCLKHNAGIDLDDGQAYHRYLIQRELTTLDESNASDSIVHAFTREVLRFDTALTSLIESTRSSFIIMDEFIPTGTGNFHRVKSWNEVLKTSSMGNGYTFELLSLILGALVRYHDKHGSVYGDDIICSNDTAALISSDIIAAGFIVNEKKSFVATPFRESCGAFYLDGRGYITCFDIKWCHSVHDVITTVNKFGRILSMNKGWKHPLREILIKLHNDLLSFTPAFLRGPLKYELPDIPEWVEDYTFLKRQRGSQICQDLWTKYSKPALDLSERWNLLRENDAGQWLPCSEWAVCKLPSPKLKIKFRARRKGLNANGALMYSYIYSARVSDMLIRQQTNELEWDYQTTLVHSSGLAIRAQRASEITVPFDKNAYKKKVIRSNLKGKNGTRNLFAFMS